MPSAETFAEPADWPDPQPDPAPPPADGHRPPLDRADDRRWLQADDPRRTTP